MHFHMVVLHFSQRLKIYTKWLWLSSSLNSITFYIYMQNHWHLSGSSWWFFISLITFQGLEKHKERRKPWKGGCWPHGIWWNSHSCWVYGKWVEFYGQPLVIAPSKQKQEWRWPYLWAYGHQNSKHLLSCFIHLVMPWDFLNLDSSFDLLTNQMTGTLMSIM